MPEPTVPTPDRAVSAVAEVSSLDGVSLSEAVDRSVGTIRLQFHGDHGGVTLEGRPETIYRLVLDADRLLGRYMGGQS